MKKRWAIYSLVLSLFPESDYGLTFNLELVVLLIEERNLLYSLLYVYH